jgi:hypothetical protein
MSENIKVFLWDRLEIHLKMLGNYMERNMWKFQHNKEIDVLKREGGLLVQILIGITQFKNVNSEHCIPLHT